MIIKTEMICDFYIYEDVDNNGFYSVGETSSAPGSFGMSTSDEYRGMIVPWAANQHVNVQYNYSDPATMSEMDMWINFPEDRDISEFSETIEFTEPSIAGDTVSWDINYPDFPLFAQATSDYGGFLSMGNVTYANTSPINLTYGFDYEATQEAAHLDMTTELTKLSDATFFNAVQGLGLAIPHYSFAKAN